MGESTSIVERVRDKLDIVEEIGAVVSLKKSGKAYKGLCPFHGERTPSFYVFPDKGTWTCFGCHEHGDIFTFVEKQQGLDFRDALTLLAERAGLPLEWVSDSRRNRPPHPSIPPVCVCVPSTRPPLSGSTISSCNRATPNMPVPTSPRAVSTTSPLPSGGSVTRLMATA